MADTHKKSESAEEVVVVENDKQKTRRRSSTTDAQDNNKRRRATITEGKPPRRRASLTFGKRRTSIAADVKEDGPTMMAVYYEETGKIEDVLRVGPRPAPTEPPTGDWMLVRVHAASCNPIDVRFMHGDFEAVGRPKHLPYIPGFDFSGVVEEVGEDVHEFEKGDSVFGSNFKSNGTMAELVMVRKSWVVKKPAHLIHEEAAAIPLAALTAYQAPTCSLRVRPGEGLIILGGSSAVGMFATQMAKAMGVSRVAVTSTAADLCKHIGADVVINYHEEDWTDVLREDQNLPSEEVEEEEEEVAPKGEKKEGEGSGSSIPEERRSTDARAGMRKSSSTSKKTSNEDVDEEDEPMSKLQLKEHGEDHPQAPRRAHMTEEERKNTYHLVLDCVGGEWERARKFPGITRFCTIVGDNSDAGLTVAKLFSNGAHVIARHMKGLLRMGPEYHFMLTDIESQAHLHEILAMVADHRVRVVLDPAGVFVLTEGSVRTMFERQASHHVKGKLVLSFQDQVVSSRIEKMEMAARQEAKEREVKKMTEKAHKEMVKRAEEDRRRKSEHDLMQAGYASNSPSSSAPSSPRGVEEASKDKSEAERDKKNAMDVLTEARLEVLLQLHNRPAEWDELEVEIEEAKQAEEEERLKEKERERKAKQKMNNGVEMRNSGKLTDSENERNSGNVHRTMTPKQMSKVVGVERCDSQSKLTTVC